MDYHIIGLYYYLTRRDNMLRTITRTQHTSDLGRDGQIEATTWVQESSLIDEEYYNTTFEPKFSCVIICDHVSFGLIQQQKR